MAFNLIRSCRTSLKCLFIENFAAEKNFGRHDVFSRQNFHLMTLNSSSNNAHINNSKEISSIALNSNHLADTKIAARSCLLRGLSPKMLIADSKSFIKYYSTSSAESNAQQLSNKDKLKRAVKEYGVTVIVFHVSISLISLGCCYLAVTSGINLGEYVSRVGLNGSSEIATEAGLFVVAYAVHKVFAPVRIGITLAATPIIVRYLRKINVLKPPKPS